MAIDDRIRDENIQYDINREVAKISVLSSGKIDKYEYLTGEEILSSNQKQIIEQAKFTFFSLGKAFGKQIKTIEDQGKKQIKAINTNNTNEHSYKDELLISKERKTFKNICNERLDKIEELTKKINYDGLKFVVQSSGNETNFTRLKNLVDFLDDIRTNKIAFEEANKLQK